jgi:hypothetical protein
MRVSMTLFPMGLVVLAKLSRRGQPPGQVFLGDLLRFAIRNPRDDFNAASREILHRASAHPAGNDQVYAGLRQHGRNHAASSPLRHRKLLASGDRWRILLHITDPERRGLAEMLTEQTAAERQPNSHARTPCISARSVQVAARAGKATTGTSFS